MTIYHKQKYKQTSGHKGFFYQVVDSSGRILRTGLSAKHANRLVKLTRLVHEIDLKLQSFNLKIGDIN